MLCVLCYHRDRRRSKAPGREWKQGFELTVPAGKKSPRQESIAVNGRRELCGPICLCVHGVLESTDAAEEALKMTCLPKAIFQRSQCSLEFHRNQTGDFICTKISDIDLFLLLISSSKQKKAASKKGPHCLSYFADPNDLTFEMKVYIFSLSQNNQRSDCGLSTRGTAAPRAMGLYMTVLEMSVHLPSAMFLPPNLRRLKAVEHFSGFNDYFYCMTCFI